MQPTLLLADDSLTIRRVIELTFADENIRVVTVADGGEAIARIAAEPPDIVLADVGMPEKDGYEVAAFVKGDPKLAHIPVLLLTGAFEPVDSPRARAIGCDGVLVKPFEPQLVISRVRELLGGQGAQAARSLEPEPSPFAPPGIAADDYFDRLDAAIAARSSATRAETARGNHAPVEPSPAPQWDPQIVTNSGEPIGAAASHVASEPAPSPSAPTPAPSAAPPAPAPPAPAAPSATAPPAPPVTSMPAATAPPAPASSLADAFTALLAAERGRSYSPAHVNATFLPDHVIDEIATRVIARLGDESMRKAVLDAAERLVTEEIARIKRAQESASR